MRRARGVTLIELVLAIVLIGIIVGATVYFLYPVTQAVDLTSRAELTDIADNALQRIGREVRLALPNSVRRSSDGLRLEFIPIRTAGRYRADGGGASGGTNCPNDGPPPGPGVPDSDQLSFTPIVDTCFKTIGSLGADASTITTNDFVVFNNYGEGFDGQNAYATAGTLNRRKISAVADEGTRERVAFTSATALDRTLHDSPGKRFFIVVGNASTGLPEPVTYACDLSARTLTRYWGYSMNVTQPTTFVGATSALIADNVTECSFDYTANVAPQVGLLTLRLKLSKALSNGASETVGLYHAVHIINVP
jgi:MSHA biogenesis protein MshO